MPNFNENDFIQLIDNYRAPDSAGELIDTNPPTLFAGISGAGKDTTIRELLKSDEFSEIVSHTTRHPRHNNGELERDGVHYHFVSPEFMFNMARFGGFVEIKRVHGSESALGDVYGTSIAELEKAREQSKIAITDVDVQGVGEYVKLSPKTVAIFVLPPDYDTWRERLSRRYDSPEAFEAEWPKRYASAVRELKVALAEPYYHFIINHEISRTAAIASEFAHAGHMYNRKDTEARAVAYQLLESIQTHGTPPHNGVDA